MADWFYGKDNAQHGPISDLEIRSLISTGQIAPETIIWREGMADWIPLKDVPEFQSNNATSDSTSPYLSPQANNYAAPVPTDGLAITSMVCGILSIVISCMYIGVLLGIPAVITGHLSLKKINNSPVAIGGKGMAIAGLVTGYLGSLISLCMIGFIIFAMILAANAPNP